MEAHSIACGKKQINPKNSPQKTDNIQLMENRGGLVSLHPLKKQLFFKIMAFSSSCICSETTTGQNIHGMNEIMFAVL